MTQKELKNIFRYEDGKLYWRKTGSGKKDISNPAGCFGKDEYFKIAIKRKYYRRSRLVFCYFHGYFPEMVDHINRNTSDDRIENLRDASKSVQEKNKRPWSNTGHKFISKITCKKTQKGFYYKLGIRNKNKEWEVQKRGPNLKELVTFRDKWVKTNRKDLYLT